MNRATHRQSMTAKIHLAKKQLGLDDETYRATIALVTQGKTSCTQCADWELENLLKHLQQKGFKPLKKRAYSPSTQGKAPEDRTPTDKLRALWIHMHRTGIIDDGSEAALDAWVQRTTSQMNGGLGIERTDWLGTNPAMEQRVIEALKQWRRRVLLEWRNQDYRAIHLAFNKLDAIGIDQTVVIQHLLEHHRIFWWKEFADMGIANHTDYCTNRRELCQATT